MKNPILVLALCFTLTACETVSDINFPSFGLFGEKTPVTEVTMDETPSTPAAIDQSALTTELDEIEKLTGIRPQMKAAQADLAEMPAKDIAEIVDIPQTMPLEAEETLEEAKQVVKEDITEVEVVEAPEVVEIVTDTPPKKEQPVEIETALAVGCPSIVMVPATKSMTKFDAERPNVMQARASITDVRGGCEFVKDGLEVDLDILMRGTITKQGRFEGDRNQEAFMTFPYFVTIMDSKGALVNKQILATAMRFRPNVDFLDHAEKITQFIPMDNPELSKDYTISVGYQLSRQQLGYNQAASAQRPDDIRVSPDTSPAQRRSYNPLAGE